MATRRSASILEAAGLRVHRVELAGDPASWIFENGAGAYRMKVDEAAEDGQVAGIVTARGIGHGNEFGASR
jgi:hypothetical protein